MAQPTPTLQPNGCIVVRTPGMDFELGQCSNQVPLATTVQAAAFLKELNPEGYETVVTDFRGKYDGFLPERFRLQDDSWKLIEQFGQNVKKYNYNTEQHEIYKDVTRPAALVASTYFPAVAGPFNTTLRGIDAVWRYTLKQQEGTIRDGAEELVRRWTLSDQDKQQLAALPRQQRIAAFESFLVNNPLWQAVIQDAPYLAQDIKDQFAKAFDANFDFFKTVIGQNPKSDEVVNQKLTRAKSSVQTIKGMPQSCLAELGQLNQILAERQADMKQIKQHLGSIDRTSRENRQILQFMADVQYKNLTTQEKIDGIHAGVYPSKIGQLDTLKLIRKWEQAEKVVNAAASGLLKGAEWARKLGVKLPRDFEKGVVAGQGLFQVALGLSTGNPGAIIGGIEGIAGLFKRSGPDINQLRHQEIVGLIEGLHEDNVQIMQMVAALETHILNLIDITITISQQIEEQSRQMMQNHLEVMLQLHKIQTNLFYQHRMQRQMLIDYLDVYEELRLALEGEDNDYQWYNGAFKTYDLAKRFFQDHVSSYNQAMDVALKKFQTTMPLDETLQYEVIYTPNGQTPLGVDQDYFFRRIWAASLIYYNQVQAKPKLAQFFEPVLHVDQLDELLQHEPEIVANSFVENSLAISESFFQQLIAPQIILRTGFYALKFHRFDPLIKVKASGELFTPTELISSKYSLGNPQKRGKYLLERVLHFTHLSIAQHHLISGGPLIPKISSNFFALFSQSQEAAKLAQLLADNPLLAKNALLYELRRRLNIMNNESEKRKGVLAYRLAYNNTGDSGPLKKLFTGWEFRNGAEGESKWLLVCPFNCVDYTQTNPAQKKEFTIPLPDPTKLYYGKLDYPQDLIDLLALRDKLSLELAGYQMIPSLQDQGLKTTLLHNVFLSV